MQTLLLSSTTSAIDLNDSDWGQLVRNFIEELEFWTLYHFESIARLTVLMKQF